MNQASQSIYSLCIEIKSNAALSNRFWSKIDRSGPTMPQMDTRCWTWTGSKDSKGYGQISLSGKLHLAHRLAFVLTGSTFPEGKSHCLHRCDNPACCNPSHLFAGSHKDNMTDKIKKGRNNPATGERSGARLHPERMARGDANGSRLYPERRPRGESHANSKLTDAQCSYIRASPLTQVAIARELGVSKSQIGNIRRGESR